MIIYGWLAILCKVAMEDVTSITMWVSRVYVLPQEVESPLVVCHG